MSKFSPTRRQVWGTGAVCAMALAILAIMVATGRVGVYGSYFKSNRDWSTEKSKAGAALRNVQYLVVESQTQGHALSQQAVLRNTEKLRGYPLHIEPSLNTWATETKAGSDHILAVAQGFIFKGDEYEVVLRADGSLEVILSNALTTDTAHLVPYERSELPRGPQ